MSLTRSPDAAATVDPEHSWPRRVLPWALLALAIALAVAIRVRLMNMTLERDEGEYAYAGQLILQGIPPYKLASNMKLPGVYGAYALIMFLFGQTPRAIHLGLLLVTIVNILLLFFLGRRLSNAFTGAAAALFYAITSVGPSVLGTQAHATHFVVAFALGGLLVLLRGIDSGARLTLFFSGLLFGIGILMKQHGVFFALFGAVWLLWEFWRRRAFPGPALRALIAFAGGTLVPLAITVLVMWWTGVFSKFWFWTVTYARAYVSEVPLSAAWYLFRLQTSKVVLANIGIWALAGFGLVAIWTTPRDTGRRSAVVTTGLLLASAAAISPGFYFREHYYVLILPVVCLLAACSADWVQKGFGPVASAVLVLGIASFSLYGQRDFLFEQTPLLDTREMYGANPFPEAPAFADYIRAHTNADEPIMVFGSEPEIYFYAHRHSASSYIYMYGLAENQPYALDMQNEMIHDVEEAKPRYFVFVSQATSWGFAPDATRYVLQWLGGYAREHRYSAIGIAEFFPWGSTSRWNDAGIGAPQSRDFIALYRRDGP